MTTEKPEITRADLSQIVDLDFRLQERGHIKIGIKGKAMKSSKGTTFQPPQKLDHFLITSMDRGPDGNFKVDEAVMKLLGDHPTSIAVMLPFDDPALDLQTFYAAYTAHRCHCRGNGERALRFDDATKTFQEQECYPKTCAWFLEKRCKPNGILSVILTCDPRIGGCHKFRTTSFNTIRNLQASLSQIMRFAGRGVSGIEFDLELRPEKVTPGTGNQAGKETTVFTVNLSYRGTMHELAVKARESLAGRVSPLYLRAAEDATRRALAAAPIEDTEGAMEYCEEFLPEEAEKVLAPPETPAKAVDPTAPVKPVKPLEITTTRCCPGCGAVLDDDFGAGDCPAGCGAVIGRDTHDPVKPAAPAKGGLF